MYTVNEYLYLNPKMFAWNKTEKKMERMYMLLNGKYVHYNTSPRILFCICLCCAGYIKQFNGLQSTHVLWTLICCTVSKF